MRCAQAQPRHDDLRAHAAVRRLGERERVRQLAPKIQPAHERVALADGCPFWRSQALRERRAGARTQQKPGALARGIGGGEQEDLVRRRHYCLNLCREPPPSRSSSRGAKSPSPTRPRCSSPSPSTRSSISYATTSPSPT